MGRGLLNGFLAKRLGSAITAHGGTVPPRLPEFMGGALVLVSDQHGIRITLHRYILPAGVTAARLIGHLVV